MSTVIDPDNLPYASEHYACHGSAPASAGYAPAINITNVQQNAAHFAGRYPRRRQSAATHIWLFLLTGGVGNVWYALHVRSWNRRHGLI